MATAVQKKHAKSSPSANDNSAAASSPLISDAKLKQLYSTMLQCRLLAESAHKSLGGTQRAAPFLGTEAAAVGAALGLRPEDWLLPIQNDLFGKLLKGVPLASILSELRRSGTSRISNARKPNPTAPITNHSPFHILPPAANPAAQLNLASGVALALQARKTGNVVMAFCGDTSDSGQRWKEALQFAARHCLPLLVLEHTRHSRKAASISKKNAPPGPLPDGTPSELPTIPVDADDVVAIYRVAFESIHKARNGGGPTLIQAISLPHSSTRNGTKGHTGEQPDAIAKMEVYLAAKRLFSPSWKQALIDTFNRDLGSALNAQKKHSLPNRE